MKILTVIGGFLALIIAVATIVLIIIAIAKGKIKNPLASNGTTTSKKKTFPFGTVITLMILVGIGWFGYQYFSEYEYRRDQRPTTIAQQKWQLCWMKKPEYEGKTDIRQKCLPARIESRSDSHIVISYSFSGEKGVREGTSTDGLSYDGEWRDSTGSGKFHMRFISPDTAFGWSDDEGTGDKQPSVFERK